MNTKAYCSRLLFNLRKSLSDSLHDSCVCLAIRFRSGLGRIKRPPIGMRATRTPAEQLDSIAAPIALYPDPFLSQALLASTYPLEVIRLETEGER
jgi:Protein of unknown function (DUF3300)